MKRLTSKKELKNILSQYYNVKQHEEFVEAVTPWVKKIGEKNGRSVYFYEDFLVFGFFSCGKNFTNIRFQKKPPKIFQKKPPKIKEINELKEKIKKQGGTYVPGSEGFFNNKRVQQFFTVVGNTPVTYWINEEGEIYGIEAV